jgi:flagellar basal body P-ring protein FlgI
MARCRSWLCLGMILALGGCSAFPALSVRSQSPERPEPGAKETLLVRDLAVPFGMFPIQIEAVGMVSGLQGTGSDPPPSPQRAELIDDMQKRGVHNPNNVLASPSTSLVLVRGVLRPGIQKGDPFDLELRVPGQSETTSLRGGYLLQVRLRQLAVLDDNRLHEGSLLALGEGPVMIDPAAEGRDDRVMLCRGRVLGGGVALKSRPLGLVLRPDHQNVANSARVAAAVNRRFHLFEHGVKRGVATSKTDEYVELLVHPRYKENLARYMAVVRAAALRESETQRADRIARLREELLDPDTAADAAIRLEAIGLQGADALLAALGSSCTEVRFYAAEALAYLDRREAAPVLGELARNEPAMRVYALNALSTMDDYVAYEQLADMLDLPSAETRYGAFRALSGMNAKDPLVAGQRLAGGFSYHVLDTSGPPMIHVTWNRRPELVLFGRGQELIPPMALSAGNQIMVTGNGSGEVAVSRFAVGEPDQRRIVSPRVDDVVRAIVELGGTYPDVVQALQEAKAAGAYAGRFEVDSLPDTGRLYERVVRDAEGDGEETVAPRRKLWGIIPIGRGTSGPLPDASGADSESS